MYERGRDYKGAPMLFEALTFTPNACVSANLFAYAVSLPLFVGTQ